MKHLESKVTPKWDNRSLNKHRIGLPSADTQFSLVPCDSHTKETAASAQSKGKYTSLLVTTDNKITKIMLNRPDKKNAINFVMYGEIMQALEAAAKDDSALTAITGCGDYYCSGNDLNNFVENLHERLKNNGELMKNFFNHFIDFPKPLVAVVNGPAVGVSVTLLGLFDLVYASDKSVFSLNPNAGCVSDPFQPTWTDSRRLLNIHLPKDNGPGKANEMLLFNKKITADEACTQGLVTEVFADNTFQAEVWTRLKGYANLPKNSLALFKQLIRSVEKEILHAVNSRECDQLVERLFSDECMNAVTSFFQRKSKL